MSLKRTSKVVLARAAGLFFSLSGAVGCTAYPTYKNLPLDCTVEAGYDFHMVDTFDMVGAAGLWTSGDSLGVDMQPTVEALPDGARCGSTAALVMRSKGRNDWGSLFGFNNFGPRDESAYEGMSFWARAPAGTTTAFTILLNDPNTYSPVAAVCDATAGADAGAVGDPADAGAHDVCKNYCAPDGGTTGSTTQTDQNGNVIGGSTGSGSTTAPDACGNSYATVALVTNQWRLYTIPFSAFQQSATANRVPNPMLTETGSVAGNGMRTSALSNLVLRMPKEANMELWMDNLSFYRKKGAVISGNGGTAP